jgi:hypothetical protein
MTAAHVRAPASAGDLERLVSSQQPTIVRQAIDHWPIMASGPDGPRRLAYIRERVADVRVTYAEIPSQYQGVLSYRDGQSEAATFRNVSGTFSAFCSLVAEPPDRPAPAVYLQSVSVPETFPALGEELALPFLRELLQKDAPRLWIGQGGQTTAPHYDTCHNLACVVAGRKRFTVFPPEQLPNLYIGSLSTTPAGAPTSLVDPKKPDLERFPRYRIAMDHAHVIEVNAGEALFLPAHWFHQVESFGLNILVNFWWDDVPSRSKSEAWTCLKYALLTVRNLPPARREILRSFFDYFVFQTAGDPYPHLPPDQQGWAGRLSARDELGLREEVASFSQGLVLRWTDGDFAWDRPLVLPPSVSFGYRGGKLLVRNKYGGELQIPEPLFELLRRFAAPATARSVLSALDDTSEAFRSSLERHLGRFMSEGLLVPADQ